MTARQRLVALADQMDALAYRAQRHERAGDVTAAVACDDQAQAARAEAGDIALLSGDPEFAWLAGEDEA
jgi:hypothetical protein